MSHWKPEHLQRLLAETDPLRLFDQAIALVQEMGFSHLGMRTSVYLASQHPHLFFYNNYPDQWNAWYEQNHAQAQSDPVVEVCRCSTHPVLWEEHLYAEQPDFRIEALKYGLRYGWTQSMHDLRHNESQLSVSRPTEAISVAEFYQKSAQLFWLHTTLHTLITADCLSSAASVPTLSEREREVTRWTADGKTAADIATILSLSTSTVNFHIRSVITKLNVPNKTAAVAIAASLGLL